MKYLPHVLITAGLLILAIALYHLLRDGRLPEISPLPAELSDWRMDMEENRLNGRADWITVEGRVG